MNENELNKVIDRRIAAALRILALQWLVEEKCTDSFTAVADSLEQQAEPVFLNPCTTCGGLPVIGDNGLLVHTCRTDTYADYTPEFWNAANQLTSKQEERRYEHGHRFARTNEPSDAYVLHFCDLRNGPILVSENWNGSFTTKANGFKEGGWTLAELGLEGWTPID